ncbi:MAG: quinone-dependent dihydroorotate dehydrogenase [Candidatus Obscuribacterales bacterium]|nr:quinone-dependent dihydroorotate dehydrogenase [Candidatus Obscuribacterales bacterium]
MNTGLTAIYQKYMRPWLFRFDPETAHNCVYQMLPCVRPFASFLEPFCSYQSPRLKTVLAGRTIVNPVGLAAGFDKNARLGHLLDVLGFGFAEIGSVTHMPGEGNPQPRLFRLVEDEAVINRMGLNGDGASAVAWRLRSSVTEIPLGVNIAKSNRVEIVGERGVADVVASFREIRDLPLAYAVLNVSCPNTHEGCEKEAAELVVMLQEIYRLNSHNLPLFLKLSPDSSDELLDSIFSSVSSTQVDGFICGNTSTARDSLKSAEKTIEDCGKGGLSGKPLKSKALALCAKVSKRKQTHQQIIGCGGVFSGDDALEFLKAGASAVEIYTALVYLGPFAVHDINQRLDQLLQIEGTSVEEIVSRHTRKKK